MIKKKKKKENFVVIARHLKSFACIYILKKSLLGFVYVCLIYIDRALSYPQLSPLTKLIIMRANITSEDEDNFSHY